jgi:porphobilinogen synthase
MYPSVRLRRNRKTPWLRNLLAETSLSPSNLILPIFVTEGQDVFREVSSMPGVFIQSSENVLNTVERAAKAGIKAVALFPCVTGELKSTLGEEAYNSDNLICRTLRRIRNADIDIGLICDIALDPYTLDGHDGILDRYGDVDNDETVKALCNQARILAHAGADIVAPSDMMDGRVAAIRSTLDEEEFHKVNILSYAAKYSSNFYGPFRSAIGSDRPDDTKSPGSKYLDKSTYQMDIRNIKEAMREIAQDINEGADMIMIKPGMPYLDVIREATQNFDVNIFAYQVSGEYSMLKYAALRGFLDWRGAMFESLICFKRAGACGIFTYAALEFAELMNEMR